MRSTYTYVILDLSPAAFREISEKLKAADYGHCFHENDGRTVIDMHGIAVAMEDDGIRCHPLRGDMCVNPKCRCHTDQKHAVRTPFPLEYGNPYCCSRCHRIRREFLTAQRAASMVETPEPPRENTGTVNAPNPITLTGEEGDQEPPGRGNA